jgi:hypothetical protein
MERMMQSIEDLKSRQAEFEKALEQKEAEKLLIYQARVDGPQPVHVCRAWITRNFLPLLC